MTESQWLAAADFYGMLGLMHSCGRMRKLRLFAVGCARRSKALPSVKRALAAVDLAERYADGLATGEEMDAASAAAYEAEQRTRDAARMAKLVAGLAAGSFADVNSLCELSIAAHWGDYDTPWEQFRVAQVELLYEVFGNPFRPVTLDRSWLTPTVAGLASASYEERALPLGEIDPQRLAVLADALEEAGCAAAGLLGHLRSPGPHVRGCWALDLILGKG
jgi:hypothetical protein